MLSYCSPPSAVLLKKYTTPLLLDISPGAEGVYQYQKMAFPQGGGQQARLREFQSGGIAGLVAARLPYLASGDRILWLTKAKNARKYNQTPSALRIYHPLSHEYPPQLPLEGNSTPSHIAANR